MPAARRIATHRTCPYRVGHDHFLRSVSPTPAPIDADRTACEAGVKIGVVSDIHCNAAGLNEALRRLGDIDELICLGDSIWEYRFSNEVVQILREREAHVILGNHEEVFLGPNGARARAREGIDPELLEWLAERPHRIELERAGRKLLLVHSTPWEPRGAYIHPESGDLARFGEADADFVLYGHTHQQVVRRFGLVMVVNPGSACDGPHYPNREVPSLALLRLLALQMDIIVLTDTSRAHPPP